MSNNQSINSQRWVGKERYQEQRLLAGIMIWYKGACRRRLRQPRTSRKTIIYMCLVRGYVFAAQYAGHHNAMRCIEWLAIHDDNRI